MGEREDLSGRTLGEFVLRERIDEGGFGAVYRCEQPLLGRQAVVKVLHQRLRRNDTVLQRFMREAQLASRLDHPYAAHVYAFGIEHDDGLFWIAMELVQGTALNRWLREKGPLSLDQLVPFFECVAEVVQTAHDRGIVHRDLKPSNVMVIERAGKLLPKLLDFGVAKLLDEASLPRAPRMHAMGTQPLPLPVPDRDYDGSEAATLTASVTPPQRHDLQHRLTHADSTIGSPPYMSPEQWNNAVTVGPTSDLYALAVIAYEALTGRRPFIASTVTEYADLHCHAAVPPLGDGMPAALDRLFERALAKRPEQRWQSALELAAALRSASRLGRQPAAVPGLDRAVRDAWLTDAPQPLAELVAALDDAGNLHHARDAARDLMRGLLRYLVALGLATRAQVRDERDDLAVVELLRTMRQRDLAAGDHVRLLRLVVRPFIGRRGAHPIPELVDLVTPHADDDADDLDPLLAIQLPTDQPALEDVVRSRLAELLPELTRVLRRVAFVLDYVLVVPRDEGVERWTGPRRRRRVLATVNAGELVNDHPMLLDRKGRVCVDLWPLAQVVAPIEGAEPKLFVFEGRGRHGARLIAAPDGYEHFDPGVWEWIADRVIADAATRAEAGEERPPYLGLAPYAVDDAVRYVGREAEVDGILERLRQRSLQVVVGPSGAGKTSFIHAGVIPRLARGWRAVTLRPGAAPLAALTSRLVDAGVAAADLRQLLATSPTAAAAEVARAAGAGTIVLVIDQLEELFTLCGCAEEREQFAAAVAQLAASADLPVRVIAAIRDDFLMQLDALPALRALLSPALVLLGNPLRDDLVRIVTEPARRAGYALSDPELANDMVSAVASRPGALALLSFTASRLWELRDRRFRQLTRSAYDAMGGVAGALVRHAEATFEALSPEKQRLAREIFRHLVTADGARAQLTADELLQRLAAPRAADAIDKLVAARLLALSESQASGESHVEVIHDALLDGWPRLQRWIREDVDGARMRDQLRVAARQWADRSRARGLLWRDEVLADVERWLRRSKAVALSELETAFVDASRRHAGRAVQIRRAVVLIAIGFLIAVGAFRCNSVVRKLAAEQRLTQVYADRGMDALLDGKHTEALVYLAQAVHRGDDSPGMKFMFARAVQPRMGELAKLSSTSGRMWWAAFSPDGQRIVTTDDGGARIWDGESRQPLASLPHGARVYQAAFASGGSVIVTAGADGYVKVWDSMTGQLRESLTRSHADKQGPSAYYSLSVAPGGEAVAAIDANGRVVDVWNISSGQMLVELINDHNAMRLPSLEFSHDGRWLATSAGDDVQVYETATWKLATTIRGREISTLGFDPTGPRLATASWQGDVSIWSIPDGRKMQHLHQTADKLAHVAFSPDGKYLSVGGQDGVNRIWNAQTGELEIELKSHHSAIRWVEFDPTSRVIVSTGSDGVVVISDVVRRMTLASFEGPRATVRVAHFDPSSRRVISASWDGTARLLNADARYLQWDTHAFGEDCSDAVSASVDRRFIAINCKDRGVQIWDTARHLLLAELPSPTPAAVSGVILPSAVAVSSTGDRAAVASGNLVIVYALPGGRRVEAITHPDAVTALAFADQLGHDLISGSRDGSVLVTRDNADPAGVANLRAEIDAVGFVAGQRAIAIDHHRQLHVFDLQRGTDLATIQIPEPVAAFRVSADGRRLLTIPPSGAVHSLVLCDLERYEVVASIGGDKEQVLAARFVHGDDEILTAGTDGAARTWSAATGRRQQAYLGSAQFLLDAALDPSATMLVTAGGDGVLRFWDVASSRMIWTLQAHRSLISGLHFEDNDIVTRGSTGELARWSLPRLPRGADFSGFVDQVARCLPLRLEDESGRLVEQDQPCDM